MKKKFISILLCAAMCVGMVTACGTKKADKEADSSTDKKDKVITVAANGSFYPIIYTDDNGKLTGFEHDVMEEIGKDLVMRSNLKLWAIIQQCLKD